ncbi:putative AAA family ATPase [Hyphomicrobiales bacterium]|nr:conserved hypothetical protein [Hyphomicrobiales bacterium]CAH1695058.1 putative AAA family ATPase [Hyphomicrobiales bacterium]
MYKIRSITPRQGVPISIGSCTVVVGPNNAGKSQFLKDITLCASGRREAAKILQNTDIDFGVSPLEFFRNYIDDLTPDSSGHIYLDGAGFDLTDTASIQYNKNSSASYISSDDDARAHIENTFARQLIAYLTTEARLAFSKHRTNVYRSNQVGVSSLVEAIFDADNSDESWLSGYTRLAFGLSVALDTYSNAGLLELRVAESFPGMYDQGRGESRKIMQKCMRLDEQGDGIRSFVATLGAVKSLSRQVILIDEPEAFLHPPQAYQLGKALGESKFNDKQIICATHSADFLRGLISSREDATVIRVSRTSNSQSINVLKPDELIGLAGDPVLSSGRVLDGIFYRHVIITESDGDAVVYGRISSMLEENGETYYVNSYAKQATAIVATPFKHMKVPHAAIVDLDMIRRKDEFSKLLEVFLQQKDEAERLASQVRSFVDACSAEDLIAKALSDVADLLMLNERSASNSEAKLGRIRSDLRKISKSADKWAGIKRCGLAWPSLTPAAKGDLSNLIDICAESGIFLVPVGEREAWLEPAVPYSNNKKAYTVAALKHISSKSFSKDAEIFQFIMRVHSYLGQQSAL